VRLWKLMWKLWPDSTPATNAVVSRGCTGVDPGSNG
jgi:hypothetical protein